MSYRKNSLYPNWEIKVYIMNLFSEFYDFNLIIWLLTEFSKYYCLHFSDRDQFSLLTIAVY